MELGFLFFFSIEIFLSERAQRKKVGEKDNFIISLELKQKKEKEKVFQLFEIGQKFNPEGWHFCGRSS